MMGPARVIGRIVNKMSGWLSMAGYSCLTHSNKILHRKTLQGRTEIIRCRWQKGCYTGQRESKTRLLSGKLEYSQCLGKATTQWSLFLSTDGGGVYEHQETCDCEMKRAETRCKK